MALGAKRFSQNMPDQEETDNLFENTQPTMTLNHNQAKSLHHLGKNVPLTKL